MILISFVIKANVKKLARNRITKSDHVEFSNLGKDSARFDKSSEVMFVN